MPTQFPVTEVEVKDNLSPTLATSAKQDIANTALAAIQAALGTGPVLVTLQDGTTFDIDSLPLPSGASTETTAAGFKSANHADLTAILNKLLAAPSSEAKQDAANTLLAAIDSHVDGLEGKDFATQTTVAAILAKLIASPATEAKQDALIALIPAALSSGRFKVEASPTSGVTFTVDMGAATPLAISNAASHAATKYIGVTVAETASATAKIRVRDGSGGTILDTITLGATESVSYTYPRGRNVAGSTVYVEVVSGTVEGSVFYA